MASITNSAPEFRDIKKIDFLPVEQHQLNNKVPVSILRAGSQEVTKIDIEFPAGAIQAGIPLIASTTANLMQEGTLTKTSVEISEKVDFLGAYLNSQTYHHNTVFTLLCLTRHLPQMLEIVHEIITQPSFPQHEYDLYLQKKYEEFLFEGEKVKTIASRAFSETIFGADHPYGKQLKKEHFDTINLQQIREFHTSHYRPEMARIFVAGQPGNQLIPMLNNYFGKSPQKHILNEPHIPKVNSLAKKVLNLPKEGAMQTAIRIGRPLFNNHHPDFIPLQILNTLLGGYFGSRLMTSVREEKGLTYGIGSFIMPLKESGVWVISSEVAGESRQKAIEAIFEEFRILQTQLVPDDEINMVKRYMMGELLRNFDGPFSTADIYRTLQEYDMDFGFYEEMISSIRNISSTQIKDLAIKYLNPDYFWTVSAGL